MFSVGNCAPGLDHGAMQKQVSTTGAPVAIVTGASSGIGEATAARLARRGYRVVAAARRIERLENLAKSLAVEGAEVLPIQADLADEAPTDRLVDRTMDTFGRIDVLVNNAGYSPASAVEQLDRESLRHIFDVNLLSQLQLISRVTPIMRELGGGRVVNLGSMAGSVAAPLAVSYSATKAGIEAASHCLRLELAPWNIAVSVVVPGFVSTEAFDAAREKGQSLREDDANPYRPLMFDLERFSDAQLENALAPDDLAQTIERAVTEDPPRALYFAPGSAAWQRRFMGLIPARLRDRLLLRLYTKGQWRSPGRGARPVPPPAP